MNTKIEKIGYNSETKVVRRPGEGKKKPIMKTEKMEWDEIGEDYIPNDGKFLFENQKVMLTYGSKTNPTHIDKEAFVDWAKKLFPMKELIFVRVAHETGDDINPYLHTHALLQWSAAPRTKDSRKFDFTMPDGSIRHPHIKKVKTELHLKRAKKYLGKEDPENADLWNSAITWQDELMECLEDESELVAMARTPQQIQGLREARNIMLKKKKNDEKASFEPLTDLSRWQWKLWNRLNETSFGELPSVKFKNNDKEGEWDSDTSFEMKGDGRIARTIITIYNPEGRSLKTVCVKKLVASDPARFLAMQGISKARDITTQLSTALKNGWKGDTILINLTRQAADHKIYNSIEMCCDGLITTEKWIGETESWTCRNVVIFTNFMPNINAVTVDRWEIYRIRKINSDLRRMDIKDCIEIYKEETAIRRNSRVEDD